MLISLKLEPSSCIILCIATCKNKGRGRNKSQASRSVDVCTQNINFTLQFEEGLFFYKVFVKPSFFSPEWQRGNDRKCFCLSPISTSQERVKALSWMPPILQIFAQIFPFFTLKKTVLHIHLPHFLPICMYTTHILGTFLCTCLSIYFEHFCSWGCCRKWWLSNHQQNLIISSSSSHQHDHQVII